MSHTIDVLETHIEFLEQQLQDIRAIVDEGRVKGIIPRIMEVLER